MPSTVILLSTSLYVAKKLETFLPKVASETTLLFINTGAEPAGLDARWFQKERQALIDAGFQLTDFTLTDKSEAEVSRALSSHDAIFVNGGHTFYLVEKMRRCNFGKIVKQFLASGGIYLGGSAGSIVAGPDTKPVYELEDRGVTELEDYTGLNLVPVVMYPHWGSTHFFKRYQKALPDMYACTHPQLLLSDYQVLVWDGNEYHIFDLKKK